MLCLDLSGSDEEPTTPPANVLSEDSEEPIEMVHVCVKCVNTNPCEQVINPGEQLNTIYEGLNKSCHALYKRRTGWRFTHVRTTLQ